MKTYLVEFENLVCNDPVIMVMHGKTFDDAWKQALEFAQTHDYVDSVNFDMYPIYRNGEDGTLYLGRWDEE